METFIKLPEKCLLEIVSNMTYSKKIIVGQKNEYGRRLGSLGKELAYHVSILLLSQFWEVEQKFKAHPYIHINLGD